VKSHDVPVFKKRPVAPVSTAHLITSHFLQSFVIMQKEV